jgi:polysaccharide deacetylase 2 family uncharacterized protein YibQ
VIFFDGVWLHPEEEPVRNVAPPAADWAAQFSATITRVSKVLAQLPLDLPPSHDEPQGSGALRWVHRHYDLTLPAPQEAGTIEDLFAPVRAVAPDVELQVTEDAAGAQVQIGVDGLLTHTLSLHWLGHRPRAAIIIDALGDDLRVARELVGLGVPLSFAVQPFRPFSKEVAELAHHFGREVLVHLPTEADGLNQEAAPEFLRLSAGQDDTLRVVEHSLAAVPHAVGADTGLDNGLATDREHLRWVMERLKTEGLFFIDSFGSSPHAACKIAATVPLPCAANDLILDESDDEAAIRLQLESLLTLVRTRGDVIAIGHPRPATLAALQAGLRRFAEAEIEVVPTAIVVADQSLSRR